MAAGIEIVVQFERFQEIAAASVRAIDALCEVTARDVVRRGQLAIQSPPKSGHVYWRRKIAHQASAPGEAPASDTGALAASGYVARRHMADYEAGFQTEYAEGLEMGTPLLLPRPYVRPAAEAARAAFVAAIRRIAEQGR